MRTNVHLDDDLLREARKLSNTKTRRALLEEALRTFIEVERQRAQRAGYADRLQNVQVKLAALRLRDRPSSVLREDRNR